MKKLKKILLVMVGALLLVTGFFWQRDFLARFSNGNETKMLIVGNRKIQAEVVSSRQKMELGLGGRKDLCDGCGMLFVFPQSGQHSFWMKGMEFPIDILWLSDNKIMQIEKNVQPDFAGILTPLENADQVLEISAGLADEAGIKVGDKIVK